MEEEESNETTTPINDFERNSQGQFTPKTIHIKEEPTFYKVRVELPGIQKEKLDLDIQSNKTLNLTGSLQTKNGKQVSFSKRFKIPDDVEMDKIGAKMEKDVLEITLPRIQVPKRKHKQRGRASDLMWG